MIYGTTLHTFRDCVIRRHSRLLPGDDDSPDHPARLVRVVRLDADGQVRMLVTYDRRDIVMHLTKYTWYEVLEGDRIVWDSRSVLGSWKT